MLPLSKFQLEVQTMEEEIHPVQTLRLACVRAKVWANETENGTMYNVTRSWPYKDGDT